VSTKSPSISDLVTKFDDLFSNAQVAMRLLQLLSAEVPKLPTDEVIERGLLFAKTNPTQQEVAEALFYYRFVELKDKVATTRTIRREDPLVAALTWNIAKEQRQDFRARLKELMQSPDKARAKHMATDMELLRKELLITGDIDDQGIAFCRFYPMTIEAGYKYVLQALYNKEQKRWKRLRKCGHCKSIFIRKISEVGGRPRDYCTPECQKKADQQKALIRQKAARKRK